jgi:hypothetical protein
MGIPTFFIALFAVLILFAATVAVYLQVYKRHINKALEATEGKIYMQNLIRPLISSTQPLPQKLINR